MNESGHPPSMACIRTSIETQQPIEGPVSDNLAAVEEITGKR